MRDLRFAGFTTDHTLPHGGTRLPVVVSVHSDTVGFDFSAQVSLVAVPSPPPFSMLPSFFYLITSLAIP